MTRCPQCGAQCVVLLHHTHRLEYRHSSQLVEWDECFDCFAAAEARGAALKAEAEADRLIKLPPTKQRMHNREAQPFISQIEVGE